MTRVLRGLTALTLLWTASLAAQDPISDRMLDLQGRSSPDGDACKLQGGDFHITGAASYLQTALTTPVADNKRNSLATGHDQALIGIQNGQAGSSKAWYYLGRIYLQQGDLVGADSAFARTVQLAPGCAAEVRLYRTRAWSALISAAATHRAAGQVDSAVYYAHAAANVDPSRPQSWYTIGTALLDAQQNDSAAWYLEKALASSGDSSANAIDIRQAAAFQAAVVRYNGHDYTGAVRLFAEALRLKSDDTDARRNLAASLRQAGMPDSASKVEASMMSAVAGSEGGLTTGQLFDIGVAQFNQHDYASSAGTFEKIIAVEPYNRDALYNLAQAYNGANNADKLLATALKLQEIDPLSEDVLKLVGAGYRAKQDQPNLLKAATALGGSTVSTQVTTFSIGANSVTLTLKALGREGRDLNDRVIRGAPITIVVEFLDNAGTVVDHAEAIIPALAVGASKDLTVNGTGEGITAWRYHRK